MQIAKHPLLWSLLIALGLSHAAWAQRDRATTPAQIEDFAEDLVRTKAPQERNALLLTRKELMTTDLRKELIRHGNMLLIAGKYSLAFDIYSFAKNVAEQIGDQEGVATASLDIGTVYFFQGNYTPAFEHYRKARELFTGTGNKTDAAKALFGLAIIYKEQRNNAEALKTFEQALKEFEVLKNKEEMANTLSSIGAIYYAERNYAAASQAFLRSTELNDSSENVIRIADAFYMQGDYKQAADYYLRSLKGFEGENSPAGLVGALGGAANSFYYQGNYDQALEYYQKNAIVQEKLADKAGVATSLQGMGNVYRARGDFGSALESYLKSLSIAESSNVKVSTATTLGSIGLIRAMQGDNTQAVDYYGKSLAQFEATGDKVGMARMLAQLGNAYYAEGSYDTAIESYRKSLALRQAMDDKSGEANLQVGIGTVYVAQKNYVPALESYQQALTLFEARGNKEAIADALAKIANVYLLQGNYDQTLDLAERASALARQVESFSTLWYARMTSGKAERALSRPDKASQAFAEAIATLESLRSQPATVESGAGRSNLLPYFAEVELLIEQNKAGEAFAFSERAKVQALCDLIRRSNAKITRSMSAAEQAAERKLTGELVSLDLQLEREAQSRGYDEVRQATLKNQLRRARAAYAEFRKTLYANHPQLKVDRGELAPPKLEDILALISGQQIPGQQTALLEYVVTEDNVYLFVLTGVQDVQSAGRVGGGGKVRTKRSEAPVYTVNLKVYPLNLRRAELVERVSHYYQMLASRDEAYRQPARELYDLLMKPAEEQLASKTQLVIVPDGILWRLPFEALQPAADRYLVEQMSVSYTPSLSALREIRKQHERAPASRARNPASSNNLAAFGNPLLTKELVQRVEVTYNGETIFRRSLERGAEGEREIQKLKVIYGDTHSRIFAGPGATEERAKSEAGRYGVLHLAAPAILDDASPMYSFVALAPGGTNQQDNGLLQNWEVLSLNSQARLVVLSGSSMKHERVGTGDAVIALVWSWFVAGTPAIVVSRWDVQSAGVAQLMADFHAKLRARPTLKRSDSKADALQQSALMLRRSSDYQHPYYWSGFALLGDGR